MWGFECCFSAAHTRFLAAKCFIFLQTEGHSLLQRLRFDFLLPLGFTQRPPFPPQGTASHDSLQAPRSLQGHGQAAEIARTSAVLHAQHTPTGTHLFRAEMRQTRREVVHVRGVREDARHAFPKQCVSVYLRGSGCVLPLAALLRDP